LARSAPRWATIERAKAEDPRELRRQLAEAKAALARAKAAVPAAPAVKEKRVEIPVLKDAQLDRLIKHYERMVAEAERHGQAMSGLWAHQAEEAKALLGALQTLASVNPPPAPVVPIGVRTARIRHDQAGASPARILAKPTAVMVSRSTEPSALPVGEHRVLTAIAQHGDAGVTREQLTILAGYKKSTRDLYVQRLRGAGHVDVAGDRLVATAGGIAALGDGFAPLPTGEALRVHWLQRLPEGERRLLQALVEAYPPAVDREAISEASGYRKSTRDLYLQRLMARRLVVAEGRGAVRAARDFFG